MTENDSNLNKVLYYSVETAIRLGILILMVLWCFSILAPFASIILWGLILAMAFSPLHVTLARKLGGKTKQASALLVVACLALIILPSWLIFDSLIEGIQSFRPYLESDTFVLPPPSEQVAEWPLIGERLFKAWNEAYLNLEGFVANHQEEFIAIGKNIASGIASIGGSLGVFIVAVIIAGTILAGGGSENLGRQFFKRLVGVRGDEFAETVSSTVRSVVKGVLGVAIIQSILMGIGMVLADVPYAGLWTLVALILAILQLPLIIIAIGVSFWLFSAYGTVGAVLWTIYFVIAAISDNVLKPILLGKSAPVPMLVIFLGVIGGFIHSGFIGLFTGAIVVSIGYKLFMTWLEINQEEDEAPEVEPQSE